MRKNYEKTSRTQGFPFAKLWNENLRIFLFLFILFFFLSLPERTMALESSGCLCSRSTNFNGWNFCSNDLRANFESRNISLIKQRVRESWARKFFFMEKKFSTLTQLPPNSDRRKLIMQLSRFWLIKTEKLQYLLIFLIFFFVNEAFGIFTKWKKSPGKYSRKRGNCDFAPLRRENRATKFPRNMYMQEQTLGLCAGFILCAIGYIRCTGSYEGEAKVYRKYISSIDFPCNFSIIGPRFEAKKPKWHYRENPASFSFLRSILFFFQIYIYRCKKNRRSFVRNLLPSNTWFQMNWNLKLFVLI